MAIYQRALYRDIAALYALTIYNQCSMTIKSTTQFNTTEEVHAVS